MSTGAAGHTGKGLLPHQQTYITTLARELISSLAAVEAAARRELAARSSGVDTSQVVGATTNPMAHRSGLREAKSVGAIVSGQSMDLRQLTEEPYVARVLAEDDEGQRSTFYFARALPLKPSQLTDLNGSLASYHGPLGPLAERDPGDDFTARLKKGVVNYKVIEKVRIQPARSSDGWDGRHDRIQTEDLVVTLQSLLEYLGTLGPHPEIEDLLAEIEAAANVEAAIREGLRRRVVDRISLRDEAVLDKYQGEVFRFPLNRRLILSGPPGTGKTTTLIKRIAQKTRAGELTAEDEELASRIEGLFNPNNWIMFTPTELLKLYLKEAFARESVPASDQRVRIWTEERRHLARDVMKILRSENGGRFTLDDERLTLQDVSSSSHRGLFEAFQSAFETRTTDRYTSTLEALAEIEDVQLATLVARIRRRIGERRDIRALFDLVEFHPDLTAHEQRLSKSSTEALNGLIKPLLNKDPKLIDELVKVLETQPAQGDEELDEEPEPERAATDRNGRAFAAQVFRRAFSDRAKELHDQQSRTRTGRNRQVLDWLGSRVPDDAKLRSLGATLVALERIRFLSDTYRNLIDQVPTEYQRFRRASLKDNRWYRADARSDIERGRINGLEVDIMLLTMLRHARQFLMRDGGRALGPGVDTRIAILESIKGEYVAQVLVDEATDFSAVQLACMKELARPEISSFFICGDVHQRITRWGVSNLDELRWIATDFEVHEIEIGYRQSKRLAALADALATLHDGSSTPIRLPAHMEDADIAPLLAERLQGDALARWLTARVHEVERALRTVPSIAIFVDGDEQIDPLVRAMKPHFAEHNLDVAGCKEGKVVGSERQIRVFDIQYIKGLEFEAVFFVGVDELAVRMPDLFDRFLFVGSTRAATYLGITCASTLPVALEPLRSHFSSATWM